MDRLIDEKEAALSLGYSRGWMQAKRCLGGGPPYIKLGYNVRYRMSDLEEWVARHGVRRNTSQEVTEPIKRTPIRRLRLSQGA